MNQQKTIEALQEDLERAWSERAINAKRWNDIIAKSNADVLELVLVLVRAYRKLDAYRNVCAGDKELRNVILPLVADTLAKFNHGPRAFERTTPTESGQEQIR